MVRLGRGLIGLLVVGLSASQGGHSPIALEVDVGVLILVTGISFIRWSVTRWRLDNGVLRIESGVLRRSSRQFPPDQIQAVDTVRPAIARMFGLAEVRVRMAAATGSSGRLAFLPDAQAEALRARLLALAHGVAEHTPAPPERVLFVTPTGPLIASILLSGLGVVLETVLIGLICLAVLDPAAIGPALSSGAAILIALGTAFLRRLNNEYELTVAESPDGIRIRSGLLQTSAETIPRGRVQAVRLIEPLLWRPFGWCRLVIDVAGKQRSGRQDRSSGASLRVVLPVGNQALASWLLHWILAGAPPPGNGRPPARARLKSPLRYRLLSWSADGSYAVTTTGRVRRVTDWVPLAKAQSIRRLEGPVQRRLRLATVHLDTAGRNIHAVARDRDRDECARLMDELPAACAAARSRDRDQAGASSRPIGTGGA